MNTQADAEVAGQVLKRVGQCLYRSEQSGRYYGVIKRSGKQIKKSLKTSDKALAKRRLADLLGKAARLNVGDAARVTFEGLAKRYHESTAAGLKPSTHYREGCLVTSLNRTFGSSLVRSISKQQVEQWATTRAREIAARTFNYERQVMIRILDYAVRDGLILDNPARVIKRQKQGQKAPVIPTREQFKTLMAAMRELDARARQAANLLEFLAYSGCRLGEALAMQWKDIDAAQGFFVVTGGERGTKNHDARVVPLFPALKQFLERLQPGFPRGERTSDNIFSMKTAKSAMETACKNASLPHFTHHHLRHFFCSNAIEAGIDFKTIAAWLGHQDGGMLVAKTYGHLRDEHSAAMAKRMRFTIAT